VDLSLELGAVGLELLALLLDLLEAAAAFFEVGGGLGGQADGRTDGQK
jgi:hypothetical protein